MAPFAFSQKKTKSFFENNELEIHLENTSKLWFTGDSTFHAFVVTASDVKLKSELLKLKGEIKYTAESLVNLLNLNSSRTLALSIPVDKLKSDSDLLNENMYASLNIKKCPLIEFSLKSYESSKIEASNTLLLTVSGDLSVACVSKKIALELKCEIVGKTLRLTGEKMLLMTDFGIDPPSMFFNSIRTDDSIKVYFDFNLTLLPSQVTKEKKKLSRKKASFTCSLDASNVFHTYKTGCR
jgi:polyisoprenoid-binding protein YceI